MTTTKITASAVSATLRRAGFQPMGSASRTSRQGLRVTGSGTSVRVCADLDSLVQAQPLALAAREALEAAGYIVRAEGTTPEAFYVTGRS